MAYLPILLFFPTVRKEQIRAAHGAERRRVDSGVINSSRYELITIGL